MLKRMDIDTTPLKPWISHSKKLDSLLSQNIVKQINDIINEYDYIADIVTWGVSDYWATPREFFKHGGDCEDFAIAKYAWLRFLGISEERLRVAIVHDRIRNVPHAILIIYINGKAMILDNQVPDIRDSNAVNRYRMIYSINREGWWWPKTAADFDMVALKDIDRLIEPTSGDEWRFSEKCLTDSFLPECMNTIQPMAGR